MSIPIIAFSTLACPAWSWEQILQAARDYGYQAIELRGLQDEMDLPLAPPFRPASRARTRQQLEDAGVTICCVSSSGIVEKKNLDHVRAHAELARDLGAPLVRVFGGSLDPSASHAEAVDRAAESLRAFGDAAQDAGVSIVLESHDAFSTGRQVAELLRETHHSSVFSLWDLHHPYREGETPEATCDFLSPTLRHIHVKDGLESGYTLMGEGDVPLERMLDLAIDAGYAGAISVEWEKRWHPEIADPEVALPQYAQKLRSYLGRRSRITE